MIRKSCSIMLAASLMALPLFGAMAQQANSSDKMGSNNSATASPGTADSKGASGMNPGNRRSGGAAAMNSNTPGATGKTVVPGSTSSQAESASGTAETKAGAAGGGPK